MNKPVPKVKKWDEVKTNNQYSTVEEIENKQIQSDSRFLEEQKRRIELENELRETKFRLELEQKEKQQVTFFLVLVYCLTI